MPRSRLKLQQGNALLSVVMLLAVVVGGYLTAMNLGNEREAQRSRRGKSSETTHGVNLSNVTLMNALVQFPAGQAPTADNPNYLPAVYIDPYINQTGQPPKLVVLRSPPAGARWSASGAGGLSLTGFDSTHLSDAAVQDQYTSAVNLAPQASYALQSKLAVSGFPAPDPLSNFGLGNASIIVASDVTLQARTGNASDHFNIQLPLPHPPKPIAKPQVGWSDPGPLAVGAHALLPVHGYGVLIGAKVITKSGSCDLSSPAGYSIKNTLSGGFSLGNCDLTASYDSDLSPADPNIGLMNVTIVATGPYGSTSYTTTIKVYKPPSCSFTQGIYAIGPAASAVISMKTDGTVVSSSIMNPFTNTPQPGPSTTITEPAAPNNKAVGAVLGTVTGPGGTVGSCYYGVSTWTPAPPPPPPPAAAPASPPSPAPGDKSQHQPPNCPWVNYDIVFPVKTVCNHNLCIDGYGVTSNGCNLVWDPTSDWYDYVEPPPCCQPRDVGCFAPETKLLFADGSEHAIDQVRVGDWLWNPLAHSASRVRRVVKGPEPSGLIRVGFADKLVTVTTKHVFFTRQKPVTADVLKLGEEILTDTGTYALLTHFEHLPPVAGQEVWNVELDAPPEPIYHAVVADGVLTGDLSLQEREQHVKQQQRSKP